MDTDYVEHVLEEVLEEIVTLATDDNHSWIVISVLKNVTGVRNENAANAGFGFGDAAAAIEIKTAIKTLFESYGLNPLDYPELVEAVKARLSEDDDN